MSSPADIYMVTGGGLMSYAPNLVDQLRRAAGYASIASSKGRSRPIFRYRRPTKYELVINLKTAKALGLEVPLTLLARADEVVE